MFGKNPVSISAAIRIIIGDLGSESFLTRVKFLSDSVPYRLVFLFMELLGSMDRRALSS